MNRVRNFFRLVGLLAASLCYVGRGFMSILGQTDRRILELAFTVCGQTWYLLIAANRGGPTTFAVGLEEMSFFPRTSLLF